MEMEWTASLVTDGGVAGARATITVIRAPRVIQNTAKSRHFLKVPVLQDYPKKVSFIVAVARV